MNVRLKIWIEKDGRDLFGGGRLALLSEVARTGSLNQAAASLGMGYRAAWGKVKNTEKRLGFALLERQTGGRHGGGSKLTPDGQRLLDAYRAFEKEVKEAAERRLRAHLSFLDR